MKLLRIILLVFLPITVAKADCGRLNTNDTYEKLNKILECIELRITDVEKSTPIRSNSTAANPVASERPVGKEEIEDNNHVPKANLISMGERVRGKIAGGDRDYYKFRTASQTEKFRVILRKMSISGFYANVTIYNQFEKKIIHGAADYDEPVSLLVEGGPDLFFFIYIKGYSDKTRGEYELVVREEN
jgi:hypothetical protein